MKSFFIKLMHLLIPANHIIKSPQHLFLKCDLFHVLNLKGIFLPFTNKKIKVWRKYQSCNISQYLCRVSKLDQHVDIHMWMTNQWVLNCMLMQKCAKKKNVCMLAVSNEYQVSLIQSVFTHRIFKFYSVLWADRNFSWFYLK